MRLLILRRICPLIAVVLFPYLCQRQLPFSIQPCLYIIAFDMPAHPVRMNTIESIPGTLLWPEFSGGTSGTKQQGCIAGSSFYSRPDGERVGQSHYLFLKCYARGQSLHGIFRTAIVQSPFFLRL